MDGLKLLHPPPAPGPRPAPPSGGDREIRAFFGLGPPSRAEKEIEAFYGFRLQPRKVAVNAAAPKRAIETRPAALPGPAQPPAHAAAGRVCLRPPSRVEKEIGDFFGLRAQPREEAAVNAAAPQRAVETRPAAVWAGSGAGPGGEAAGRKRRRVELSQRERGKSAPDSPADSSADHLLLREALRLLEEEGPPGHGAAGEAGPSRRVGAEGHHQRPGNGGRGISGFRGVTKVNGGKGAKPWTARIKVTEDGKGRLIHIGNFAREDAARAYDRVSIAKLGHAKAKTNFPVAEYRAEWGQLEALGVEGAVARERR